jgi:hypothetical protein
MGLCDVLRIELEPCQLAGAIDELEERRGPLHESFEQARTRWDALAERERERATGTASDLARQLSASAYALRVLTAVRAQLPTADHGHEVTLVGPASTLSDVVAVATANAVDDLAELVRKPPTGDAGTQARLRGVADAAVAWVATFIECQAVEWFNFDPDWDPVASWPTGEMAR